ncbi:hypothetical protein [Streptomyces sp. NPDC051776]|uniref:hypothetical protein n=1 Tax=Streptomyces sp. NPDC051776 TaxID=3155414 RepID=UPI00343D0665
MTDQPEQKSEPPSRRRSFGTGDGDYRINMQGGRDVTIGANAQVAGNNIVNNVKEIKKTVHRHPVMSVAVLAAMTAVLYGGGSAVFSDGGDEVDLSVVEESGSKGAIRTVEQIRKAEKIGDGAAWCAIVAPSDAGCAESMKGEFARRSPSYRDRVDRVEIGKAERTDAVTAVTLSWDGVKQGTVPLVRSGDRWQMRSTDYAFVKLAGGVFLSLVDSRSGQLKVGGIPVPS